MLTVNWCRRALIMLVVCQSWGMRPPFKPEELDSAGYKAAEPCQGTKQLKSESPHNSNRIQEFFVDHQISKMDAERTAKEMSAENNIEDTQKCDKCTKEEMNYCLGSGIIDDHCCCDGRFSEPFKFVPHTCYKGTTICKTVMNNCEDYARIKDCCCIKPLVMRWKSQFQNSSISMHKTEVVRWIFTSFIILKIYLFVTD